MASSDLAAALRDARRRARLSVRELATRIGVSTSTVHAAETGGDPRLSTLKGLVRELGLPARLALARPDGPPAWEPRRAWELHRELAGFTIEHVSRLVVVKADGRSSVVTRCAGMAWNASAATPEAGWDTLLGAAWMGRAPPTSTADAELTRGLRVDEPGEDVVHEARLIRVRGRPGLEYWCTERLVAGAASRTFGEAVAMPATHGGHGVSLVAAAPTRVLVLAVRFEGRALPATARYAAWPGCLSTTPSESDIAPALGVLPDLRRSRESLVARIERPLPRYAHALLWGREAALPPADERLPVGDGAREPRVAVRRARHAARLSQRQLARRGKLSPATVQAVEQGSDPRRSTMLSLLRALPGLRAEHVLPNARDSQAWDAQRAWELDRAFHGFEIAELSTVLDLTQRGSWRSSQLIACLRTLPGRARRLVVATPSARYAVSTPPPREGAVQLADEQDADELRMQVVRSSRGVVQLVTRIPRRAAERGLTLEREGGSQGSDYLGKASFAPSVHVPVRTFRLVLHFPPGASSLRVEAFAALGCEPLVSTPRDVLPNLRRLGLSARLEADGPQAVLDIDRPLLGVRYGLRWWP